MSEFTHILERVEHGDPKAAAELLPVVYEELRRLAAQKMASEAAGHTLQPTALVHEAWMRLGGSEEGPLRLIRLAPAGRLTVMQRDKRGHAARLRAAA